MNTLTKCHLPAVTAAGHLHIGTRFAGLLVTSVVAALSLLNGTRGREWRPITLK
jgi:hypothetical protein